MNNLPISLLLISLFLQPAFAQEDCSMTLREVRPSHIKPGEEITLIGEFGEQQDAKLPVINKGGRNDLQVTLWSQSLVQGKLPIELQPGTYKVGIYCQDPALGRTRSSGFKSVEVLESLVPSKHIVEEPQKPKPRVRPAEPAADADTGMSNYWWLLLLIPLGMLIPVGGGSRKTTHSTSSSSKPAPDTTSTDQTSQLGWTDTCAGTSFIVDCYFDETLTVEIDTPENFPLSIEIDARAMQPNLDGVLPAVAREVQSLLSLGATYIDIHFNTNRIAAEFPEAVGKMNHDEAKKIAYHLVCIKKCA